ncbi:hypothetical protein [Enterococcus sp. CWB-B31]|uniref:hypothetical protein n=1 Tax=Enterococcus sp. CWB-B31 TaxID=2885159 RepID=UPI001E4E142B|nr:hypothetical protein [Enterococcus sp. CWB-B31]MCB5953499.1 hypothetical protein [Enterococcus sp. CWB-B31]
MLKQDYKDHFKKDIPEKIIRRGNPLNILDHHEELEEGVRAMDSEVKNTIATNTPVTELSDEG